MLLTLCTGLTVVSLARAAPKYPAAESTEWELRQNTKALLDAIAPGDVAVWDRLLDENALQVDENDVVRDKAQVLAELKPLGPGLTGHLDIDDFRVTRRGDVAVVTHEDNEYLDYHGQIIRSRFRMTDTWIHSSVGWRQLGSQVLAVLQDPPSQTLDTAVLCAYGGEYKMTNEIVASIRCESDGLVVERQDRPARHFKAELADVFFEPGEPRTRRIFVRDRLGRITGFVDRREARDIHWTKMMSASPQALQPEQGMHGFDFEYGKWRVHHRVKSAANGGIWTEFDGTCTPAHRRTQPQRSPERGVGASRSRSGLRIRAGRTASGAASRQPLSASNRAINASSADGLVQRPNQMNVRSCSRTGRRGKLLGDSSVTSRAIGVTRWAANCGNTVCSKKRSNCDRSTSPR